MGHRWDCMGGAHIIINKKLQKYKMCAKREKRREKNLLN